MRFSIRKIVITILFYIPVSCGLIMAVETQNPIKHSYFEGGLGGGYISCYESGLHGTTKGNEIIKNLGRIEAYLCVSYTYKNIQISWFGSSSENTSSFPSKYSSYGADTVIAGGSDFWLDNMDFNVRWKGLFWGPINIQPMGGLYSMRVGADINGEIRSTAQTFKLIDNRYTKTGPLVGINTVLPIYPLNPKREKVIWGIEPEYDFVFGDQRLQIIRGQVTWDVSNPDKKTKHISKIFLGIERWKGRGISCERWKGGLWLGYP